MNERRKSVKKKTNKIKIPKKLKKLGFKKTYEDKDGFFMFELSPKTKKMRSR
jgi:hypothetical protein